jgi:hypothetical protein
MVGVMSNHVSRTKDSSRFLRPALGAVIINDRVSIHAHGVCRVVLVHGVIVAQYDISDRAAEEYAMLTLLHSGYANQKGDPLFVVTAEANAAMTGMIIPILQEVRKLLGTELRLSVVFDRGGWNPATRHIYIF